MLAYKMFDNQPSNCHIFFHHQRKQKKSFRKKVFLVKFFPDVNVIKLIFVCFINLKVSLDLLPSLIFVGG
jgi:hypothetical protein